jgi:hypothetical protein
MNPGQVNNPSSIFSRWPPMKFSQSVAITNFVLSHNKLFISLNNLMNQPMLSDILTLGVTGL